MAINIPTKFTNAGHDELLFQDTMPIGASRDEWSRQHEEGQLAVDVYETESEIVLKSAIAGISQDDLDVFLHNDMLTVRGTRKTDTEPGARHMVRECHWGPFSRSVILPSDVDADKISAILKDGVLTVRLPKVDRSKRIAVREVE